MQRPVLCCPEPSVRNAQYPHEIPNSSTDTPTTPGYACKNPLFVKVCEEVVVCTPTISSAPGDTLAGLLPGTSISVQKNTCCALKVTTSAGSFIVGKDMAGYSTGDFNCDVTVTGVEVLSGTCSLSDVIVTTQKAG